MSKQAKFATKIGLVAATVGSAVGLGNVWRFPYIVGENGGGAFLLVYILCLLLLGIPVMVAEFIIGRRGNSDVLSVFNNLTPNKKWWITGAIGLVASLIILSYYMVVAGWTAEYLWQSITGGLYEGVSNGQGSIEKAFTDKMHLFTESNFKPLIWIYVFLIANFLILIRGVQKGIERLSNIMMPFLFIILIILAAESLTLPGASDGLKYFLSPDFDKINSNTFLSALGQAFYSLSLGMGILITYSSYFPKTTSLIKTASTVATLDLLIALIMGVVIFPAVMTFNLKSEVGTTLVFVTLPEVFTQMPMTRLWSTLFFSLLAIAALSSTISIAEVSIAVLQNKWKITRLKAASFIIGSMFILSTLCSLSLGSLSNLTLFSKNIFDLFDFTSANILLPICALLICIYVGWILPKSWVEDEITSSGIRKVRVFNILLFLVKYVAPILILAIFYYSLFA